MFDNFKVLLSNEVQSDKVFESETLTSYLNKNKCKHLINLLYNIRKNVNF